MSEKNKYLEYSDERLIPTLSEGTVCGCICKPNAQLRAAAAIRLRERPLSVLGLQIVLDEGVPVGKIVELQ